MNFYEVIKIINTTEDGRIKNELIGALLTIREERNLKTGEGNDLQCVFSFSQLKSLMAKMQKEFKDSSYINIHISDVFTIILDTVCDLKNFNFNNGNEVALYVYLEKKVRGKLINEYNKVNKIWTKNNFKYESSEVLEDGIEGEEGQEGYCNKIDWFKDLDQLFNRAFNYQENFNKEFNWECDEKVFLSWIKFYWDYENIMNKKLLNSTRVTESMRIMEGLKSWREWTTQKQKEKIEILLNAIEEGHNIFKYTDDYRYILNLKEVGKILYPNRKGNCNKDIQDFINSIKKRFTKYLDNTNKSKFKNYENVA